MSNILTGFLGSGKTTLLRRLLAEEAYGVWLSMLLHTHGDKLLRVKGIVNIQGNDNPVVIQGVQHVMYPPEHLNSWNGRLPSTQLAFICRGLSLTKIKRSFDIFALKKNNVFIKICEIFILFFTL